MPNASCLSLFTCPAVVKIELVVNDVKRGTRGSKAHKQTFREGRKLK